MENLFDNNYPTTPILLAEKIPSSPWFQWGEWDDM